MYMSPLVPIAMSCRAATPCEITPNTRHCWGEYSVDTNYITTIPDTGRTVEVWLSGEEATCNPDGFERTCMTFNGTMPGPPIVANWGDTLIVHVTNNLKQTLDTVFNDGVPGVTQCPIPPGESMTYKFKVTQYGTSWYHSHISLQYSEGLFGALIFHGPASADYDEDLGKFETVFQPGKKYLIRLVNVATDSQFQFSIDGHKLTVIANDFVPIKPYVTDSVTTDYWLRAYWVNICAGTANDNPKDSTGIVRYDATSKNDPTSVSVVQPPKICNDEPLENLEPYLNVDVSNIGGITLEELRVRFTHEALFTGTINSSTLQLDWSNPTLNRAYNNDTSFPTELNVVSVDKKTSSDDEWTVLVIENKVLGLLAGISHPIHLHGHDFWILAQENGPWDGTANGFMTKNPPRRGTAVLPAHGHLAIAFRLDNPGSWLLHCHIAWHAGQGLSMQFVERKSSIDFKPIENGFHELGERWDAWSANETDPEDGSGI
ncbi:uncharacterized protein EI97DRAFT_451765 [Westerdykella ornata]|uniref:Multicopper oxidase n=1 Tax=Westerdykella ornata TaxID=318751 RepID=A0A6A6JC84_WESOR|nr:uncharacterized protein EI97DRAFT_451765 [Westerdykella ornata]KAF2274181.1 hypothetical protein EI97DRAFT_451765 [Westerdykella ornata]